MSAACGRGSGDGPSAASPGTEPSTSAPRSPAASPTPAAPSRTPQAHVSGRPVLGGAPPPWLGKRVLPRTADGFGEVRPTPPELVQRRFTLPDRLPALPGTGFASRVTTPAPAAVIARSTWKQGCPVAATDLSWVRLTFRGFDGRRHTGELLVNRSAAGRAGERVPRRSTPRGSRSRRCGSPAPTSSTRRRPATGTTPAPSTAGRRRAATSYSQHAYGLAIDVNPFQNPYSKGDLVLPELASAYLDRGLGATRDDHRRTDRSSGRSTRSAGPGAAPGSSLKDCQHFSRNGR